MNLGEDRDEWAGLELVGYGGDFAEASRFTEGSDEPLALGLGSAEAGPLGKHDGPREDASEKQDDQDGEGDRPAVMDHLQRGRWC